MNAPTTFPPAEPIGMAQLREADRQLNLRTLFERFERDQMEAGVDLLLEMLDALDGDLDVEANGDEFDGDKSEDEFMHHFGDGPGCLIADVDVGADDADICAAHDRSYAEWHTLSASMRRAGKFDGTPIGGWSPGLHEDVEEDDQDAEHDGGEEGTRPRADVEVHATKPKYGVDQHAGPINYREVEQKRLGAVFAPVDLPMAENGA